MSSTTTSSGYSASGSTVTQYGFFFDQSRCDGCNTCQIACKSWHMISPGPTKWCRLFQWEKGSFPNVRVHTLFAPCYHCQNPVCIPAANGAMFKEPKYGAVLIDPAQASSPSLKAAWKACPYGAIAFDSDAPDSFASHCNMCIDRLEKGQKPTCVTACTLRALDFDTMDNLKAKYGTNQQLEDLPDPSVVKPAIIFKAMTPHTQIVPYDSNAALTLLGNRPSPLPPVFTDPKQVTTIPSGVVGRGQLNLHPATTGELMLATEDNTA